MFAFLVGAGGTGSGLGDVVSSKSELGLERFLLVEVFRGTREGV
jgi:hypothetical protein